MYSFHVLVESGVLETIVKLKSRVGQRSARECMGVSNPLYVVYIIYGLTTLRIDIPFSIIAY